MFENYSNMWLLAPGKWSPELFCQCLFCILVTACGLSFTNQIHSSEDSVQTSAPWEGAFVWMNFVSKGNCRRLWIMNTAWVVPLILRCSSDGEAGSILDDQQAEVLVAAHACGSQGTGYDFVLRQTCLWFWVFFLNVYTWTYSGSHCHHSLKLRLCFKYLKSNSSFNQDLSETDNALCWVIFI